MALTAASHLILPILIVTILQSFLFSSVENQAHQTNLTDTREEPELEQVDGVQNEALFNEDLQGDNDIPDVQQSVALLILSLREKHKLPISTTNEILREVPDLCLVHEREPASKIERCLEQHGVDTQVTISSDILHQLSSLSSERQQINYFRRALGFIEPLSVKLGISKKDVFQYVPIIESLKCQLKHRDVLAHLLNFRFSFQVENHNF